MRLIIFGNCLQNTVGLVRSLGEEGNKVTLLIEPCKKVTALFDSVNM